MKRGRGLRRKAPLRARAALRTKARLRAKKRPARKTKLKPINRKRIKRLRMEQGLDGPKADWIRAQPCCVTGALGTEEWPIDCAHVGKTRGAGADGSRTAPLWRPVHSDFDSLTADKFEEKYGVSKTWVRDHADSLEVEWRHLTQQEA